ncbi:G2/mitotic-specific cyclin-B [Ditylenchus destructor]|nr:G2/mitotic-specific cyclin-B [Ditylenchus destructor]
MPGKKENDSNVGRITRGLKTSAIVDENEAQHSRRVNSKTEGLGNAVALKDNNAMKLRTRNANNTAVAGLAERSINITTRSMGGVGKLDSSAVSKEISKPTKALQPKQTKLVQYGGGNMLVTPDCAEDIDAYLRHLEEKHVLPANFLGTSIERGGIDGRMRQILVDWLVHVQRRFTLLHETFGLAIWILDRSLVKLGGAIGKHNLQLLGVACLFVASKYEEITIPHIADFVYVAADGFTKKDVLRMEQTVLKAIDFQCSIAQSVQFVRRYRHCISAPKYIHNLAKFISEVALVSYSLAHYKASTVAAASLYLAALIQNYPIAPSAYSDVMHISEQSVISVARSFVQPVLQLSETGTKLYALREKYQKELGLPFNADQMKRLNQFASSAK